MRDSFKNVPVDKKEKEVLQMADVERISPFVGITLTAL